MEEVHSSNLHVSENKRIIVTRTKSQRLKTKTKETLEAENEIERLRKKLEHLENMVAKQSDDYKKLVEVKSMLQNENQRMFDEVEFLQTQQERLNSQGYEKHDDNDYAMLLEVKNNLQDENDRLTEELGFYQDKYNKLQADNEYLNKKQEVMQKKLDAERSLRMAAEEEINALEKKREAKRG
jgi:chromosome segregation ATPase